MEYQLGMGVAYGRYFVVKGATCAENGEACFVGFASPPAIFVCGEVGPHGFADIEGKAVEVCQ